MQEKKKKSRVLVQAFCWQGGPPAEVVLVGLPGTGLWRSPLSSRRGRTHFKKV